MTTLTRVPQTLPDVIQTYGNPDANGDMLLDADWYQSETAVFELPYPMRQSWTPYRISRRIRMHKLVGPVVLDALKEVKDYQGYEYLRYNSYEMFGGAYNFRLMAGGTLLSTHAWGIAIDINPHLGPYLGVDNQPEFIKDAFRKRGMVNLQWDAMHFQACAAYWR